MRWRSRRSRTIERSGRGQLIEVGPRRERPPRSVPLLLLHAGPGHTSPTRRVPRPGAESRIRGRRVRPADCVAVRGPAQVLTPPRLTSPPVPAPDHARRRSASRADQSVDELDRGRSQLGLVSSGPTALESVPFRSHPRLSSSVRSVPFPARGTLVRFRAMMFQQAEERGAPGEAAEATPQGGFNGRPGLTGCHPNGP